VALGEAEQTREGRACGTHEAGWDGVSMSCASLIPEEDKEEQNLVL